MTYDNEIKPKTDNPLLSGIRTGISTLADTAKDTASSLADSAISRAPESMRGNLTDIKNETLNGLRKAFDP